MNVYVVMGNDFPAAVFSNKEAAERFCTRVRAKESHPKGFSPRVYWRVYAFEVDKNARDK